MNIPYSHRHLRFTHLSSKGQLTIPRNILRELGWKAYDPVTIKMIRGGLAIVLLHPQNNDDAKNP